MADNEKIFHAVRLRAPGGNGWYDPECDVRSLLPELLSRTLDLLDTCLEGSGREGAGTYLRQCINVFRIRLAEDKTPLGTQINEFFGAICSLPADIRFLWYSQAMSALLCLYGLFCRRDSAASRRELGTMLDYSETSALKSLIGPGSRAALDADLKEYMDSLLVSTRTAGDASAVIAETGEVIDGLKTIAGLVLGPSAGTADWNELSDMCDKAFMQGGEKTARVSLALGLAYPSYKQPYTVMKYEPEDETGEAGDAAGHGPVQVVGGQEQAGGGLHPPEQPAS